MRCCFVFHEPSGPSVGNIDCLEAPPLVEFRDTRAIIPVVRVLERLSGLVDPVNGIVLYEEVVR